MNRPLQIVVLFLSLLVMFGCSSKGDVRDGTAADVVDKGNAADASATSSYADGQMNPLPDASTVGSDGPISSSKIIYFGFDSYSVDVQGRDILATHAQYLSSNPAARIRLEGHGDERGSREYNIGLGDRRAQAVKQVLSLLGASDDQISIISFGEEKPVDYGHTESAWRQNRRVEIAYASN